MCDILRLEVELCSVYPSEHVASSVLETLVFSKVSDYGYWDIKSYKTYVWERANMMALMTKIKSYLSWGEWSAEDKTREISK